MKKDLGAIAFFSILLIFSFYLIISGLTAKEEVINNNDPNEIVETELQINPASVNLIVGEEYQINATVIPENATYKNLTWESANNAIATVDNGIIKAISPGNTVIKVSTEKRKISKLINVTVTKKEVPVTEIKTTDTNIELEVGDTRKIEYEVLPKDATNKKTSIQSSDKSIAGFNSDGLLVAVKAGTATITIKASNDVTATINVTVKNKDVPVTKVSLNKTKIELVEGATDTLTATVSPSNATNKDITWSSSDNNIAKIDNGKVTAVKEGTATITVTTKDGNKKAECKVTVKSKQNPPIVPGSSTYKYEGSTLKYYVVNKNSYFLTYIWMEDPYNQVKKIDAVTAKYGKVLTDAEITGNYTPQRNSVGEMVKKYISYGIIPANKAAIAFNASGFYVQGAWNPPSAYYNNRSDSWLVITDGKLIRNRLDDNTNTRNYIIGIDYNGNLKIYDQVVSKADREKVYKQITEDKIKNTWSFYPPLVVDGKQTESGIPNSAKRQVICQVNSNNYIMFTAQGNFSINEPGKILLDLGCKTVFNLDGGGSTQLFIKKPGETYAQKIKCSDGSSHTVCRSIVEGIYFTEK